MPLLTLLGTSDVHAHIHPWNYFRGKEAEVGLAKISTLVKQERARQSGQVILIDNGDTFQGNPLATYFGRINAQAPHPVVLTMAAMGYDAMIPGNHDYNYGAAQLETWRQCLPFPLICANVRDSQGQTCFLPYLIKEIEGIRVAILGLTTPRIDIWERPEFIQGLQFEEIIPAAQALLPQLQAEAVDVLIASVHSGPERLPAEANSAISWRSQRSTWVDQPSLEGENMILALAQAVPEIDVILCGHTHQAVPEMWVDNVLITQPHFWGSQLSRVRLHLEKEQGRWQIQHKAADLISVTGVPADPEILALTQRHHHQTLAYLEREIGQTLETIPAGWQARFHHGGLAGLINQIQIEAVQAAGVAVDLSLACIYTDQGHLQAGPITLRDAYRVTVYENILCVLEISGEILRAALEQNATYFRQLHPQHLPSDPSEVLAPSSRPYQWDIYAGIDYTLDLTQPEGKRVQHLMHQGQLVDDSDHFRLVLNSYRAHGGGGFPMFRQGSLCWQSADDLRDYLVRYIQTHSPLYPTTFVQSNFQLIPDLYDYYLERSASASASPL
ncbi:MAG: bifunctional metallophosphatase/5'-nucleotidase [Synechococcaceae cyanobacterium SM2_3_1]|nr:bifunctional metallophosphatase/5'-nucleotidase [Synechococcaceae cyanobacterium SM2_3_1]